MTASFKPWDDDDSFGRVARAPDGTRWRITGVRAFGGSGPVFLGVDGDHRFAQRLVHLVNPLLTRLQRPRSHESARIEISRKTDKKWSVIGGIDAKDLGDARRQADVMVAQIAKGTFEPPDDEY